MSNDIINFQPLSSWHMHRPHPTWDRIFNHLGDLEFLQKWVASLLYQPFKPLPYLYFCGGRGSGKSTFHEAISLLLKPTTVCADHALSCPFNGEMSNAVLCYVEEADTYNSTKLEEWVTGRVIRIERPAEVAKIELNRTHWVEYKPNDLWSPPVFYTGYPTVCFYPRQLDETTPKPALMRSLVCEAPQFMRTLFGLEHYAQ